MTGEQKDRYIQYLDEENQDLKLIQKAMELVLEDLTGARGKISAFISRQEVLKAQQSDLKNQLSEECKTT